MARKNMLLSAGITFTVAALSYNLIQSQGINTPETELAAPQSEQTNPFTAPINQGQQVAESDCNPRVRVCEEE